MGKSKRRKEGLPLEIFARPRGTDPPGTAVRALLADAVDFCAGIPLPAMAKTDQGKPYFPDRPDLFFSLSHSGSLVLCAVGSQPCGADVQEPRSLSEKVIRRCFAPDELACSDPIALWCLKESFIKLTGSMDRPLRDMVFLPSGDVFTGPDGTAGRVWRLPGRYTAALVCRDPGDLPSAVRYGDFHTI